MIVGDFNLCFLNENSHEVFKTMKNNGYQQIVKFPTHEKGRLIDLVFSKLEYPVNQQSPFFSDHDIVAIQLENN